MKEIYRDQSYGRNSLGINYFIGDVPVLAVILG